MRDFLNQYCERAGMDGFFAEPLNLVTNAAFLIAAWYAWRKFRSESSLSAPRDWDILVLIALVFFIGLGSAAWHAVPIRATLIADVLPITLFIHFYLLMFCRRVLTTGWITSAAIVVAYIAAGIVLARLTPPGALNSSMGYVPGLAMMAIMAAILFAKEHPVRWGLLAATALFAASLSFRTGDRAVCDVFPIGTHFIWHTLNAGVLALLVVLLVASVQTTVGRTAPASQ